MKIKTNPYSNFNGIFSDKYVIGGEKYSTTMQRYPGEYYLPNAGLSNQITMPDKVVYINDRYGKTQYKGIVEDKSSDSYLCSDHVNMTDSSGDFSIKLLNKDLLIYALLKRGYYLHFIQLLILSLAQVLLS